MQKRGLFICIVVLLLASVVAAQTMTRSSAPRTQERGAECHQINSLIIKVTQDIRAKIDIVKARVLRLRQLDVEVQKIKVQIDILLELIQKIQTDVWWQRDTITC